MRLPRGPDVPIMWGMTTPPDRTAVPRTPGTVREVFWVFLRLGLTSFGGPVAHLGYFREAFVVRRQWLGERAYADLVALCQFLPGPASSQVGMALGLQRAGVLGLLAAWTAFTLPSAVVLVALALGLTALGGTEGAGWIRGLLAVAVGVVAHAVIGMTRTLAPDLARALIAVVALVAVLLLPGALTQVGVIVATGLVGLLWLRADPTDTGPDPFPVRVPRRAGIACLAAFGALLVALPLLTRLSDSSALALVDAFYRAGALVFGGGHVVLPLLQADTVATGLVSQDTFLAGYSAAQAVPGPLFTVAAFLGASTTSGPTGIAGAAISLVAIFLPAGLLVVGALPFWEVLRRDRRARRALRGVNAGVVGILAAALVTPVLSEGVTDVATGLLAIGALLGLSVVKVPAWAVVIAGGAVGGLLL